VYLLDHVEDFFGAKVVKSRNTLVDISLHGKSLARASLTVGEAGDFSSHEGVPNEWTDGLLINFFIIGILVISEVKVESCFFQVLGQIYFLSVLISKYLYSLIVTCPPAPTRTMSVSDLWISFLFSGRFLMATVILGVSVIFMFSNVFC
jgi:hypothetical protein